MNEQQLTARLSEAFCHGERLRRELRLSPAEAAWVETNYPAVLTPLGEGWYDIEFQGAYC